MELVSKIDDYGKPAWIALMIVGFIVFWPVGLALLAYLIWSGRMGCRHSGRRGRWHFEDKAREFAGWSRGMRTSGNRAFDEYREDTLRRLEDEYQEFRKFLDNLRHAKDKAEFDQFMAERRKAGDEDTGSEVEGPAPQQA